MSRRVAAGQPPPRQVDRADLRVAQHRPGGRGQDRRNEEGQGDQHFERAAKGCVGARDDPGEEDRECHRQHGLDEREADGVGHRRRLSARQQRRVAVEVELARHARWCRMEAAVEQHAPSGRPIGSPGSQSAPRCRTRGRCAKVRRGSSPDARRLRCIDCLVGTPIKRSRTHVSSCPGPAGATEGLLADERRLSCAAVPPLSRRLFRRLGDSYQQAERLWPGAG